jgi:integrase
VDEWCGELRRTRRPATVVSYRSAVTIKEFAGFLPRRVADITRADVAEVIAKIHKRAERQAETSVIAARSLYSFLARDDMVARTGVLSGSLSDLKAPERTLCEDEESDASLHVPDGREIGRLVRALRDTGSKRSERDRLAGLLLVYSCQRRRTVAAARVADFEEIEGKGLLWSIPALHRKTASLKRRRHGGTVGSHLVPLPGPAADVVRRAMEIAGSGVTQLFPPARNRRLSQPSLHMQPETITHMFSDIESVDLSPHDVRRALGTTWAATQTASREELIGAVKEILDHAEGVVRDVTSEHYMLSRGDGRKWKTMSSWVDWVEEVSLGDGQ